MNSKVPANNKTGPDGDYGEQCARWNRKVKRLIPLETPAMLPSKGGAVMGIMALQRKKKALNEKLNTVTVKVQTVGW